MEFINTPSAEQLEIIKKQNFVKSLKRFDSYPSPYFQKLYEVSIHRSESEDLKPIQKRISQLPFVKKVEKPFEIAAHSIIPSSEAPETTDTFF